MRNFEDSINGFFRYLGDLMMRGPLGCVFALFFFVGAGVFAAVTVFVVCFVFMFCFLAIFGGMYAAVELLNWLGGHG